MPEYLFDNIYNIFTTIEKAERILLLLDYDGTLVSFRERPMDVTTSYKIKNLLTYFIKNPKFIVVIVSGRSLHEIKQLLDIDGLSFAALHGLQIEVASGKSYDWQPNGNIQFILKKIKKTSVHKFKDEKSVYIEDKRLTLAFHYRTLVEEKIDYNIHKFLEIVKTIDVNNCCEIIHGAKVIEIRPKGWNKGKAIEYLFTIFNDLKNKLPIYIGDDTTDEDAFRTIGNRGITVFVSNKSSQSTTAQYWLKDPDDVLKFLQNLKLKLGTVKNTFLFE